MLEKEQYQKKLKLADVDKEQIISINGIKVLNVVDWLLE